jgi:hypothetical protein
MAYSKAKLKSINELENAKFRKLDLFPSLGEERDTPTLLGPLERVNPSYGSLKFRTMDKVLKPSDSGCYTPSSEPLRFEVHSCVSLPSSE